MVRKSDGNASDGGLERESRPCLPSGTVTARCLLLVEGPTDEGKTIDPFANCNTGSPSAWESTSLSGRVVASRNLSTRLFQEMCDDDDGRPQSPVRLCDCAKQRQFCDKRCRSVPYSPVTPTQEIYPRGYGGIKFHLIY
jgi:hypothetical protein